MKRQFLAVLIVTVLFATSVYGGERKIQLRWEELAGTVQGQKVQMVLPNGADVEGKVLAVEPQALQIKVSRASNTYEKGVHSIPRSQVSVLRFQGRSGPWRALGTAIGAGGGAAAGIPLSGPIRNEGNEELSAQVAVGFIAAGAAAGYFIGRSADRQVFVVSVVD